MRIPKSYQAQKLGLSRESRKVSRQGDVPSLLATILRERANPTVDDAVGRLIAQFGLDAVRASVQKYPTKNRRGRPAVKDYAALADVFREDARSWLAGRDPFADRSNYRIARDYATKNPGQSQMATIRRVEGKLAARRRMYIHIEAMNLSREGYPYSTHFKALKALKSLPVAEDIWREIADLKERSARSSLEAYREKYGGEPEATLSMEEIEERTRNAMLKFADQSALSRPARAFGLLSLEDEPRD